MELASVDIDKVLLRLASRKFATDAEQTKQQREAEDAAKRENKPPSQQVLLPSAEVAEVALALLEKMDIVLQQNSGVGLEDVSPSKPLTK